MTDPFDAHYQLLRSDPGARRRLIEDPNAELARFFGSPLPEGSCRVEIVEQRIDTIVVVIPCAPEDPGEADVRLGSVAGHVLDLLFTSGIGGYLIPEEQLTWVLRDARSIWAGNASEQ